MATNQFSLVKFCLILFIVCVFLPGTGRAANKTIVCCMPTTTSHRNQTITRNMTEMSKNMLTGNETIFNVDDLASDQIHLAARFIMGILFLVGVIFGVFGNILVLLAVWLTKTLRMQVINLWVCNLSLTDLSVSCFSLPILGVYMAVFWPSWAFGNILCKISVYVANVCAMESIITLTIIAVDRYFAVVRNRILMNRRIFYMLMAITWIFTAAALSYPLSQSGGAKMETLNKRQYLVCQRMTGKHLRDGAFRKSSILKISAGFLVMTVLIALYLRMAVFIYQMRRTPTEENHNKSIRSKNVRQADKTKVKAVKMLFVVVLVFLFSWGPYWIVTCLRVFPLNADKHVDPTVVLATYTLAMLNSAWNPLLYALMSRSFRRAYRAILKRGAKAGWDSSRMSTLKTNVRFTESTASVNIAKKAPTGSVSTVNSVVE